jgi:hypothetical protein
MNFEELLATLSKGSATAVTTLESNVAEVKALKEYRMHRSKNGTGSRLERARRQTQGAARVPVPFLMRETAAARGPCGEPNDN